jgi:hypothetical protein
MPEVPMLETQRRLIRPFVEEDLPDVYRLLDRELSMNDSRIDIAAPVLFKQKGRGSRSKLGGDWFVLCDFPIVSASGICIGSGTGASGL